MNKNKESSFPTHADFCELLKLVRKDKPELSKWLSYPLYIIFLFGGAILIIFIKALISEGGRSRYPSNKYRKVVKEGIFWDDVEWHER